MPGSTPRALNRDTLHLAVSTLGIVVGGVLWVAGRHDLAHVAFGATTVAGVLPLLWSTLEQLRRGRTGVDLIALLAMAGALAFGEYEAGAVLALMLASGRALEDFAERRAQRELSALLERAPRQAHRYRDGELVDVAVEDVAPGDLLLVKPGEVVPVDGVLASETCVLDESALTGESMPVVRERGDQLRSGAVNAGAAFDLRAGATAAESTYAGIVRLVEEAQAQKAPFVRLADRYALWFIPTTLAIAGAAWAISGDPVRALAVLVVATPCPMILAAPIAIVAGISRAAKRGVIVKGGGALETLARGTVLLLDKTGTLTAGTPEVADVETFGEIDPDEVLRLAASLDQVSPHVLAAAIVRAARDRGLALSFPSDVHEEHGRGIEGKVDGHVVALGTTAWTTRGGELPPRARDVRRRAALEGASCVFVAVDGRVVGALILDDPIRPDSPRVIRTLRRAGVRRVVMVTGDHPATALAIARSVGIPAQRVVTGEAIAQLTDEELVHVDVFARVKPEDKLRIVAALQKRGEVVAMTGDGVNDAPALKRADVGVAMGQRGSDVSREVAALVLMDDNFATIVAAIEEGRSIYENIQKFIRFLFSTNVALVLLVLLGLGLSLLLGLREMGALFLPLTAVQLLWINIIADGPPALALGVDRNPGLMRRPPRDPREPLLDRASLSFILLTGMVKAFMGGLVLLGGYLLGIGLAAVRTAVFVYEGLAQLFFAYPSRLLRVRPLPNRWLDLSVVLGALLQVGLVYWAVGQALLGLVPLGLRELLLVGAAVFLTGGIAFITLPLVRKLAREQ